MPLDKGKLQKLYSTLQQGGYSQSYDEFESGFTGNDNYPSRKKVYDLLTEHGADIGNSYEDFMGKMQAPSQPSQPQQQNTQAPAEPAPKPQPATKPNPRPKPRPKGGGMTAAERSQFIRNAHNIVSSSAAGIQHVKNQIDYANGNRGLKVSPVHLGQNSKVVRRHANGTVAKPHPVFDVAPEQQPGDTYLTESGNEFANRDKADTEQNAVDQYRYEQSETGQLNNAYAEAERLDKLLEQRGEKLEDENRDKWWRDLPRGGGGAVSTMNANDNNGRMTDTEYLNLLAARKKVDEQIRDLKAARDEKTGTFLGGLWRGFRDYAFDPSNWDNGYRDLLGTEAMLRAKTGAAQTPREKASERTMMEDTYKAGVAADNAEKVLGNGYSWMRIGAQSLPFALQFMAGNATGMIGGLTRSGEGMGVKLARKIAIKQGANNMMRNIGRSVLKNTGVMLGDLGAATALTTTIQAGQTGADIGQRYAGDVAYDPKTDDYKLEGGKSLGRSIYEGVANSTIENYTEQLGEHMHLGKYASSALTKMGLGRVSNWFTKVGKTDFMQGVNKYMEMAGFNGYPQEVMEEEVGMPLHAIFDGGNKMSDLLDGRQQLDIVGGMLFSMAGMGGASMVMQGGHKAAMAVQYHQDQHKLDNSDKVASFRLTADKWAPIKEEIDGTTNEDFGKTMKNVLSNDELSDQDKQAVWDYAQRLIIMRGHNMGQEAATRNGMTDKETNAANESYTQGYNTNDATAMNDAKNRLAAAQQKLDGIFGENTNAQQILDAKKEDGSPYFTANDRKAAQAVVNAQQEYEGMMQRVRDDIDDEVQQTGAIYDSRTNDQGVIQSATLKAQNPDGTDKKVYITSGNVVMTDDGKSVDNQKSDMSIVVVDEDGKVQMISPDELFSLDTPIDGAQAKQQALDAIQQSRAQEAADKINGKVNLTAGSTYTLTDNTGQQIEATIVADGQTGAVQNPDGTVNVSMNGKVVPMDVNTLQQMVDNTNMQRTAQSDEEDTAEEAAAQQQPTEPDNTEQTGDEGGAVTPEGAAVPTYPGSVVAPDVQAPHEWQVDDTFTIDNGGMPVRGQVTGVGEDGVEIYTESPVNGKKMQVVSPEELQSMTTEVNGEAVQAQPEEAAAMQQPTQPVDGAQEAEQTAGNGANGENGEQQAEPQQAQVQPEPQTEQPQQPQRAIDRIPSQQVDDGKGNVRTVHNWEQAEPGDTYDALTEIYHGNADRVKKGVQNRIGAIDKQINSTQKQMDAIDNSDDFDAVAAQGEKYDQLQQQKAALEQQKKYWQGVQNVPVSRRAEQDKRTEEEKAAAKAAQEKAEAEAAEKARQEREQVNGVPDVVNDIPSDARKRGFRNVNGMVVNRQGETQGVSGRESNVKFSSADTAKGHIKVIDADELQPSHVSGQRNPSFFIDEAQPKDRTDTVSGMVAAKIAADLNPEEITGDGSAYQFSAPTVNSRGEVIQGNNRSDALKLMYSNPAFKPAQDVYKQYIADHAEEFGFTPEDVAKIMQMEHPVMVNELDVPDDEAIRLGQMRASDNESGGIERIDPVTTSQKLGGKVSSFANVLLSSPDEDASLSDVLMQNGAEAVKWLRTQGAISDTAAQSAFDKKGNLTPEARMDLQNILKQSLFQGGVSDLPTMFDKIPAKAQKAILSTFMRDFDSAESERILPEIQRAIEAWYGCAMSNEAFAKASNYKGAKNAMHDWERQTKMLDDNMPSDKFSNFARELACRLQGCGMRETQQSLNDYFDLVQGKSQGDLFGGKMGEQADRQESIRRIFNIEYKPISNNNGKTRSNAVADNSSQSGEGQQGSPTDGKGRERAESGSEPANGAGGTENHDEEGIKATHPSEDSSHSIGSTSSSEKKETERQGVNTEPTEKQKEAGNYKKGHIKVDGYDITIENPKGSTRSGKDASGKAWSVPMHYDYGYIKGTEGVDGDHIDVYLSDNPTSGNVYVVDQVDQKTGKFDEHKVMYGFPSKEAAVEAYKGQYEKGWKVGTVTEVSREDFKKWVESSKRKTKPFSEYNSVKEAAVEQQPTKQNASTDRTEQNQKRTTTKGKTEKPKKANAGKFGLVSDERMEELKKRLRAKLNNLNMGVDPEVLAIGLELAAGYIDRGVKKFADYSKAMINDLGDVVRPYLKAFYNGVRDMPEINSNGLDAEMDDYETVSKFNVATIGKDGEDTKPSILDTAEQVSNESHVERAASNVSDEDVKSEQKENTRYSERGFTLRPATEEDVEKNMPIYVDGKRTHIVMLVRKGEQVGAAQFSKPVIEGVYTTDNERVPLSKIEVEEVPTNALSGKKTSSKENNEKKKAISSQQDPSLFDDLFEGEEAAAKQPTEQKATEQTSGQAAARQYPAVITTDDEKGKEKPVETKPEKELSGDSAEYQQRQIQEKNFVIDIQNAIDDDAAYGKYDHKLTMSDIKKMAQKYDLLNDYKDTDLQELVERAMTLATRQVAQADINKDEQTKKAGFDEVVRLYQSQPSLNARDSSRVAHQQYSTPTPFGYVMDMFMMGGDKKPLKLLEPSAGNGALTIGIPAPLWHVNDIDERRLMNLRSMPYGKITNQDGTMPFEPKAYDAVATNPPFGSTQEKEFDGGRTKISSLEGLMAINALASMKDDGRAAIIIGGNTQYMSNGAMQAKDMKLFKYLYTHYNVVDVINLDGDMYKRNGTGYNVRMILIAGRKTDVGDNPEKFTYPPVKKKARAEQVKTFDELYKRVENDIQQAKQMEREPSAAVNSDGSQPVNSASERTGNSEEAGGVQQQPVRAGEMERRPQPGRSVRPSSAQDGRGNGERIQHGSADRLDNADGRNAGSNHAVQGNRPSQGQSSERREVGSTGRGTVGGDQRGGTSERNNTNGERPKVVNNAEAVPQRTEPHAPQAPSEKVALGQEKVAYPAKSQSMTLQSRVPAAQAEAIADNLDKLGDVDEMVRSELGYSSKDELYSHLAAEQIDSVALAINQMKHGRGFIIGDMTGVGKGRQGAALIRWAIKQGKTPIYFTQKARLYTDNYRDMCDIGSKGLHPFLIASNDDGNIVENVVDENGEKVYDKNGEPVTRVVYGLPKPKERERVYNYILQNGKLPKEYDYVLVTYSQIQSGTKTYEIGKNGEIEVKDKKYKGKTPGADKNGDIRRDVLEKLAKDNYVFLDESHTVGGQSSSGLYMQDMLKGAEGVTYLSATFAKRPDNMPLYAMKTAMSESGLSQKDMIDAIQKGGVTLQEIMSKQLVQSGQMIRRERDFTGVSIDWEGVDEETDQQQRAQFDEVAKIFNAIREFQDNYVDPSIEKMSEDMAEEGKFSKKTQGTSHMGVNNVPFASKMYNLVNQLLFSLKANAVADKAIECLKKGEKPVISFNNTMEGFLDDMPRNTPMPELPNFSLTLMRALEGTLRYTEGEIGNQDNQVNKTLNINGLGDEAIAKYNEIRKTILNLSIGLPIDPMDAIKMRIEAAGYKVGEITGRKSEMVKDAEGNYIVQSRISKEMDGKAAASAFNSASGKNGGLDVLLINKSGSTGISLHASSKFTDQSPRAMIAAQFQSDINDEVQMRGRIDRTGQVHRGRYIYLVSSIPAEQRLQMMFKNKLKSLDANTTSSQKSKFNDMEVTDFMNKYGDEVTWSYMIEHPDLEERLGDPLNQLSDESKKDNRRGDDEDSNPSNGCAGKILRRLPFLSVNEQEQIFNDLSEAYKVKLQILNDAGENDLEITTMPLRAEPRARKVWKQGSDPDSGNAFADNTYLETAEVDVIKKPMKANEVREYSDRLTDGKPWEQWHEEQHEAVEKFYEDKAKAVEDKAKADAQKRIDKAREDYIKGCLKARKKGDNNWSDEEISHMADIAAKEAADKEQTKINNRYISIDAQRDDVFGALDAFTPLEPLIIPMNLKDTITTVIPSLGTFIGIKFGKGYSRSSSTAVFATLDGRRKIEVPLSDKTSLDNIKHQSLMLGYQARGLSMDNWDSKVPTKSRKTAYIVTGNLMQALVDTQKSPETKGQLISYTTIDGDVKQGILMNDRFKEEDLKTSVPISSMMQKIIDGDAVESADKEVKIERGTSYHYNDYKLSVPKSKSRGGKYFLDKKLLRLLDDEFTTSGGNMVSWVNDSNLKKVLDYLSKALGVTVQVKANLEEAEDSPHNDEPSTPSEAEEGGVLYREVDDEEAKRLDNEPTVKVYRAMQEHDGKLYPPMSGRVKTQVEAKNGTMRTKWVWRSPIEIGKWEQSEEHPEMANEDGTFTLDKGNGSTINAAYNPYIHTSRTPINDQFSSAWNRPELVTVEVEVPASELTSGYHAEKAKDSTGEVEWKSGPVGREMAAQGKPRMVILSRWDKPVRIVPVDEVADEYAVRLAGTGINVPFNTVPPALRDALVARGVEISEPEKGNAGQASRPSYEEWLRGNQRQREGNGTYSDEELSLMNDPVAKWLGKSNRTKAQQKAFANRERKSMETAVRELAERLHLDNVNIVMDASSLEGRKARAKGFYDRNTNEITIVIPNHRDVEDVMQTLLHEGVAHYGLRKMFGEHFDTFLDNVYAAADDEVRKRITDLALRKYKGDFRVATEEYLASLAERTDFEHIPETFWQKIKSLFLDMLHAIGFENFASKGVTLSDNELRYILWRSYENLKEPGRYRSILGEAEDVAMQADLKVGNYSKDRQDRGNRLDSPDSRNTEAAESREDAIKRLKLRLLNTFKNWAKARNAFDEAFEKDPDSRLTFVLGDELNKWNDLMDEAKDVSMEHGIDLGELLRDNGISGDDLKKYDDMFGGRAAGEPQAWGKQDMLSKAEQVSHGIDPDLLFRDAIEDDDNTARETYNRMADEARSRLREAWQDSMINVRNLQQAVLEQRGEKLEDYEDAYNAENRSHGKSRAESEYFTDNLYKPLLKAVDDVAKAAKVSVGDVTEYMMAKHGLERNIVFARRDADAAYKKAYDEAKGKYDALMNASRAESDPKKADALEKQANKVKFPDYDDIFNHLRMRDYAGLTALTGKTDTLDAENEAKRIVADMESRADTSDLWKKTNDATKWTLDKAYQSGIISKDNYKYVSGMFNYYVPLRGWQEDTAGDLFDYVGSGDKGTAFSPTLHKAKGRRSEADNPIAYIGSMAVSAIVQGNKNKVKQTFLGFVENHPTNLVTVSEMWYRNFGTDTDPDWREDVPNIPEDATADEVADIVQQHEDLMEQLEDLGKATKKRGRLHLGVPVKRGQALEHHVEVMVNGKKYVLYINGNPRAAQALNGTRQRRASERSFESSKIARMGRLLAERYTSLSPSFTVSNAIRDLTMAAITTLIKESPAYALRFRLNVLKLGGPARMFTLMRWYKNFVAKNGFDGVNGLNGASETQRYFYEFMAHGAETGFTSLKEIDEYKKDMDKMYRNMNQKLLNPKRLFRGLSKGLEYANRCIEDMTRFAIYMASRQSGRNVKRSVNDAKNITLNFNRKGSGELGNATYRNLQIFVNPAIQSLQNVGKMAKDHPVRFNLLTGSIALIGAAQVFATQLLWSVFGGGDGDDDYWNAVDEYWKLPSWQRRNNLVIWIPGTKNFAMIPLAQEFRVFHGFGETMTTVMEGKSDKNPALEVLTQTSDLLPLDFAGNNGNPLVNLAPTVTQPLLQVGFNTDFTGRPLYKDNDFNKYEPSFQKAYVGTPSWLIKSSEMINDLTGGDEHKQGWLERTKVGKELNNPAVVDHILKGYYGGMYSFFAQLGGTILTLGTGNMPDAQEVPVVNRVITATRKTEQGGKQKLPDWYYDLLEENDRQQNEFSGYKKDYMKGDADGQRKFNELIKGKDFQKWQKVNTYIGAVQQIRTAMYYTKDPKEKAELKQNLDEVLGELKNMKDE